MKYFFTLFTALLFIQTYAQNMRAYKRDSAWISIAKKDVVELKSRTGQSIHLQFGGFVITDARPDSSYIGIKIKTSAWNADKSYEKLVLEEGTSVSLMKYLNGDANFSFTSTGAVLTCYVKQLRITGVDSFNKATGYKERRSRLNFEVEAYITKDDLFYPALRLDTVAIPVAGNKNDFSVLTDVLNVFAAKAALIDTGRIFKRTGYKPEDLDKRYLQKYNKPILQTQQLNAGVYKTFSEFINNGPSVKQYEFKKDKKATILYTKIEGNDWLPESKAFGFCDGKIRWLNMGNVFYPLVQRGNTFEFLADYYTINNKGSSNSRGVYVGSTPGELLAGALITTALDSAMDTDPKGKIVYQLDMENGTFY
jgi:hypothetical protein